MLQIKHPTGCPYAQIREEYTKIWMELALAFLTHTSPSWEQDIASFALFWACSSTEFLSMGLFQSTKMQLNVVIRALADVQFISLGVPVRSGSRDDFYHHIISIQAGLYPQSTSYRYTSYIG